MNEVMFSSNSNEWVTPQEFFDKLDARPEKIDKDKENPIKR